MAVPGPQNPATYVFFKTTLKYDSAHARMARVYNSRILSAGEDAERLKLSDINGGNAKGHTAT